MSGGGWRSPPSPPPKPSSQHCTAWRVREAFSEHPATGPSGVEEPDKRRAVRGRQASEGVPNLGTSSPGLHAASAEPRPPRLTPEKPTNHTTQPAKPWPRWKDNPHECQSEDCPS